MIEKTALVTGAAKRLGRAIALELAGAGWNIALHYSTSREDAENAAAEIRNRGVTCAIFAMVPAPTRRPPLRRSSAQRARARP